MFIFTLRQLSDMHGTRRVNIYSTSVFIRNGYIVLVAQKHKATKKKLLTYWTQSFYWIYLIIIHSSWLISYKPSRQFFIVRIALSKQLIRGNASPLHCVSFTWTFSFNNCIQPKTKANYRLTKKKLILLL